MMVVKSALSAVLLAFAGVASWAQTVPSDPVPLTYFGLHIHRADAGTAWPNVPFGSWRLWDAYVGWAQLEPERGKWDFTRLDKYAAMARITKTDLLLPLAMTPRWAAARPDEPSPYKPGNSSEPASLVDWENYVATVAERYKGRIMHYEVWNEPSDKSHFTGNLESLVRLTCAAYRVLKKIDPGIQVVSPASAGGGRHLEYLDNFLRAGGKLAFGSDVPVESADPFAGLATAMTREDANGQPFGGWRPEERVSREQALAGFTTGAAYAAFAEYKVGSLTPGHRADFVLIDIDPLLASPTELRKAVVRETWVGGRPVYKSGGSAEAKTGESR